MCSIPNLRESKFVCLLCLAAAHTVRLCFKKQFRARLTQLERRKGTESPLPPRSVSFTYVTQIGEGTAADVT